MRNIVRRLSPRYGISVGLIIVIAFIVVVARLVGDNRSPTPYPRVSEAPPSLDALGNDGVDDRGTEVDPVDYADNPALLDVARDFVSAWARSDLPAPEWLDGLRTHATDELISRLADVDPSEVPDYAMAGEPTIRSRSEIYADVIVPIASHDALALGLVCTSDGWLVASVDRETG